MSKRRVARALRPGGPGVLDVGLEELPPGRFPLERVTDAYLLLESHPYGRVLVLP